MAKRSRRRRGGGGGDGETGALPAGKLKAPTTVYSDPEAGALELRGSMTLNSRAEYAATLSGGLDREDAWQRAVELLFERLVVSWTIAEVSFDKQKELIARYRMAGPTERHFVRQSLRTHLAENFPDMEAP